jgi:hypothetical protein
MPAMNAAAGFGGDAMKVDPATLATIAGILDDAGAPLLGHASALEATPDAGASSGLVAGAMQALATAVAGLSGEIGDLASSTGVAGPAYADTDHGSEAGLRAVLP